MDFPRQANRAGHDYTVRVNLTVCIRTIEMRHEQTILVEIQHRKLFFVRCSRVGLVRGVSKQLRVRCCGRPQTKYLSSDLNIGFVTARIEVPTKVMSIWICLL